MAVPPTIVEFQDTFSIDFGGVWISSDFYSGGYRLCLVLKSTKVDRPTNQRRITKPSQEIAIIALDDGSTDRQWPCEGTATMRFEFPRQKHLRGGPNPSFLVNFSIGQPSANVELRVKFQGNLPPGFVRSWTSIPQACIPLYQEYSPPSIFDRDKSPFQQPAGILTNSTGNITVKIEDIQIALKGVKRALDSSPPEGIKKLELDPESTSTSLSSDLIGLSERLLAEGLISPQNIGELRNRDVEEADQAARLVELVQEKVEQNPQNYFSLIRVLGENESGNLQEAYMKSLENIKHYKAYQQALEDGSHLTLSYLKFLFFGAPRSGKTSTRRRLIREILNLSQLNEPSISTGVAETNDVIIKKFTSEPAAIAGSHWWSMKRANKETVTDSEGDLHYLTHLFCQLIRKRTITVTSNQPAQVQPQSDSSETTTSSSINIHVQENVQPVSVASVLTDLEGTEIKDAFEKLTTILQSDSPEELERLLEELILINMMDVGGQPAFLDMLPALTIGPALYLLFIRLDQELKVYYPVRFLPGNSKDEITLESSYSIEEVLFQSLASIACYSCPSFTESASMPQESRPAQSVSIPIASESAESASKLRTYKSAESASKPQASSRALLFGTYKDQVNDDQISQMEHTLQEQFMKTKLYGEGLLLKSAKGKMLLTVDNMFGTDESEMSDIRQDIERIIKANFPPVPIPASWLMFRIVLSLLKKPVVSLAQCEEIAQRLSMPTPVKEALWFFHHNIGSLMYYPDIPSLDDTVICNPQVIFDCITTLIIDKFKYKNRALESHEVDEFYQKGQFSLSHIKDKTEQHGTSLTPDQLVDLLKHHNVLAEIKHDQQELDSSPLEPKLIIPAVLKFATDEELSTQIATSTASAPIVIHFEGGFVPFGVFSTCTAHLIARQDIMSPKWQLCEDDVRRNKIIFCIDSAFYATIISRPQYLEIVVSCHPQAWSKWSLSKICSTVRQTVVETLKTVISKMKYKPFGSLLSPSTDQPFDLAFTCCLEDSHGGHLMKVVEDETGRYAKCLKSKVMIKTKLEEKHHIWFGEDKSEPQSKASTSHNTESSSSADELTIDDLNTVENAIWSARSKWYDVGLELGIIADTLDAIQKDCQTCKDCYIEMLKQWLRRSDPRPSWSALADALRSPSLDEGALADQLPPKK